MPWIHWSPAPAQCILLKSILARTFALALEQKSQRTRGVPAAHPFIADIETELKPLFSPTRSVLRPPAATSSFSSSQSSAERLQGALVHGDTNDARPDEAHTAEQVIRAQKKRRDSIMRSIARKRQKFEARHVESLGKMRRPKVLKVPPGNSPSKSALKKKKQKRTGQNKSASPTQNPNGPLSLEKRKKKRRKKKKR